MESTIHQRLEEFIDFKKLSKAEFGKKFRASRQEIHNWTTGTKMNVYRIGDMLEAYPKLNSNWLLTGDGPMIKGMKVEDQKELSEKLSPECMKVIMHKDKEIHELNKEIIRLQKAAIEYLLKSQ